MDKDPYKIAAWIIKYLRQELSVDEERHFEQWLESDKRNRALLTQFEGKAGDDDIRYLSELDVAAAWQTHQRRKQGKSGHFWNHQAVRWSAAALIPLAISIWWFVRQSEALPSDPIEAAQRIGDDVAPGETKALLVLSDGQQVNLGEGRPNRLTEIDGTTITDSGYGGLAYAPTAEEQGESPNNRLVVPKAGTYQLTLSDGTKVWVNALSELEFPVAFDADERRVRLKGEAYFEVAKDARRPFLVDVANTTIEVLGTHFNINAYAGVKTTLVEGSVRVSFREDSQVLKPGQQAWVTDRIAVNPVDVERMIAWKNGEFLFASDQLGDIMDELSRWYDITVVYQGQLPKNMGLTGSISRDVKLSQVLDLLAFASGATFTVDNRTVTVIF